MDVEVTCQTVAAGTVVDHPPANIGNATSFSVDGVARYTVSGGRSVHVEAVADADARNVRLFLLGSAIGILLQQRGVLPIHANAVVVEGQAVLFMGGSGEGKSTLASWFHDRGMPVLADDVAAVTLGENGRPHVFPGLARLRLWDDALRATGRSGNDYARSFAGDEDWTKYDVPIGGVEADASAPVAAIYELRAGEEFGVERLTGASAFERVVANIYRGALLAHTDPEARYWRSCTQLIAAVPIFVVTRPWNLERFNGSAEAILAHARGQIG